MLLLIVSFIAGVITVLTPCVLPLLPLIIGGSVASKDDHKAYLRPLIVTISLVISIIIFTLLLRFATGLLGVPASVWSMISGSIVILLGLNFVFPSVWKKIPGINNLSTSSNKLLGKNLQHRGFGSDVLTGAALGPVFNSCSPTYGLLVATVLPASFGLGMVYLTAYSIGLGGMLLMIGYAGQSIANKLNVAVDPHGKLMKAIGIVFVAVGVFVFTGYDAKLQEALLDSGVVDPILKIEESLR